MSGFTDNTRYFNRILTDQPANNAPYLTRMGYLYIVVCMLAGICSAISLAFEYDDLFSLLSACVAAAIFLMAVLYGMVLLSWRAFQIGIVRFQISSHAQKLTPNDKFDVLCQLDNPLWWPIFAEAIRLDVTPYIKTLNDAEMSDLTWFPPKKRSELCFRLKAMGVGNAAILGQGIIITDSMHLFRAEIHVEAGLEIPIYPAKPENNPHSDELTLAIRRHVLPVFMRRSDDIEAYRIHPWQSGDETKRILWRGYAKRQELMVREPEPRQQNSLLCLIDAGQHMRLVTKMEGFDNPLIDIVERITRCVNDFDNVTLVVYDELSASIIVHNAQPDAAISKLEHWLLERLRYHLAFYPDYSSTQLAIVTNRINQDFRLYRGVDFKRIDSDGARIDLLGMTQWARADLITKALQNHDDEKASFFSHLPYPLMLEKIIQYWYREPMTTLPPKTLPPLFSAAVRPVVEEIKNGNTTLLMWFSDFAETLDENSLNKLTAAIAQAHIPAIGVQMNMPLHSLNFIASKGSMCQTANCQKLSSVMDFVK